MAKRFQLTMLFLLLPAAQATAAEQDVESKLHPARFSDRYAALPFEQPLEALAAVIEKNLRASNAERIRSATDPHERDRIQAELAARMRSVRDSFVEFKGQKTGYNVSVVAGEFQHNTQEAMIAVPVARAHDYFFLIRGGFWKLVTTEVTRQSFPGFLLNLTQIYGAPTQVFYRDAGAREDPIRARWQDETLALEVRARPDYGAITLTWTWRKIEDRLAELRGTDKPETTDTSPGLDPTILDILKD